MHEASGSVRVVPARRHHLWAPHQSACGLLASSRSRRLRFSFTLRAVFVGVRSLVRSTRRYSSLYALFAGHPKEGKKKKHANTEKNKQQAMADKIVEQPEVAVEEVEKDLKEKKAEEVAPAATAEEKKEKTEEVAEEAKENGAEKETNGKEATNGDSTPAADAEDKCCIKRKSTGAETEEAKKEEVIPEKKAKLDEDVPAEAENGAEVAA